ncbi:MAG: 16S rRNA (uracil(1498)-N(3))-methyltransferase [Calditrichaeota bacterium]|nr:16S rRNA (uracil(1498)-N(3))-methyltransferase [Calditrichota bacterium]
MPQVPFENLDFYFAPGLEDASDRVELTGEEVRHLARAARHRVGDVVGLTNGHGLVVTAKVEAISRDRVVLAVVERFPRHGEPTLKLTLGVGMISPNRLEWLVEKAVEVGVVRIVPLATERSERRRGVRLERLERIAVAATKQCQRAVVPEIAAPVRLSEFATGASDNDVAVLADPLGSRDLGHALQGQATPGAFPQSALALVGPEGGFSPAEVDLAVSSGFVPVSLGSRRLRTETAALHLSILLLNIRAR